MPRGTAPQPPRSQFGELDLSPFFSPGWVIDRDYLTASIWTPDTQGSSPVVVYLHGGAFIAGSAYAPAYDGSTFARDGIVYVAINYRLGVPGFLRLVDAPDNRGLLDVLAALRWVQGSIAAFGGDPERVTIMGQSAGAILIQAVTCASSAEGLFARAISQSGSPFGTFSAVQAESVATAVASDLGLPPTAAALAQVPDADFVRITSTLGGIDLNTDTRRSPLDGIIHFGLVSDKSLLEDLATGPAHSRPMLFGSNLDEAALYPTPPVIDRISSGNALRETAERLSSRPDALIDTYRSASPSATDDELRVLLRSDGMFSRGTRLSADTHAKTAPTYLYEFDWRSNGLDGRLGACHLMELPFVFDRTTLPALTGSSHLLGSEAPPSDLAARMHNSWVRFIRDGDPGWPQYEPTTRIVQRMGHAWQLAQHHRSGTLDAWPEVEL